MNIFIELLEGERFLIHRAGIVLFLLAMVFYGASQTGNVEPPSSGNSFSLLWNQGSTTKVVHTDLITCRHLEQMWRSKGADVECKQNN